MEVRAVFYTYNWCFLCCSEYMAAYDSESDGGGDIDDVDDAINHVTSGV